MSKFSILRTLESTLPTLAKSIGRVYYCQDTGNLYIDTIQGRIPQLYTFINTELERLSLDSVSFGYYYIFETNTLWIYNNGWRIFAENQENYPAEFMDKVNANYNIFADSLNLLVNQDKDNLGSLQINPDLTVEVHNNDKLERVIKSHNYGVMIFNGDICYQKDGKLTVIRMDDGCLDYADPPDNESPYENYSEFITANNESFYDANDLQFVVIG